MSSVDFLVKVRDGAQQIADACNEQLEKMAPPETDLWDPEKIKWEQAEGAKGPYERYPGPNQKAESTDDYRNMLEDLKAHNERMMRDGYFYWIFTDGATVGRKKKRSKPEDPHAKIEKNLENVKEAGQKLS